MDSFFVTFNDIIMFFYFKYSQNYICCFFFIGTWMDTWCFFKLIHYNGDKLMSFQKSWVQEWKIWFTLIILFKLIKKSDFLTKPFNYDVFYEFSRVKNSFSIIDQFLFNCTFYVRKTDRFFFLSLTRDFFLLDS